MGPSFDDRLIAFVSLIALCVLTGFADSYDAKAKM